VRQAGARHKRPMLLNTLDLAIMISARLNLALDKGNIEPPTPSSRMLKGGRTFGLFLVVTTT